MVARGAGKLVGGLAGKFGFGKSDKPADIADEMIVKIYQVSDNLLDKSKS